MLFVNNLRTTARGDACRRQHFARLTLTRVLLFLQIKCYMKQLLAGLAYCHQSKVCCACLAPAQAILYKLGLPWMAKTPGLRRDCNEHADLQ